jgi:predicted kinase
MVRTVSQRETYEHQELSVSTDTLTLALMAGLPASGKTTIAKGLARQLEIAGEQRWKVVDKDDYRIKRLDDGLDRNTASHQAYDWSFNEIRRLLLKERTSVIFDSAALYPFILKEVGNIINDASHITLKIILCVVDYDTRHERLLDKSPVDITDSSDPLTEEEYLARFDHLKLATSEPLILHTDTLSLKQCIEQATNFLCPERSQRVYTTPALP